MFLTLLCLGLVLLGIEFMIPGFGIFGMAGLASLLGALFFYLGADAGAAAIVGILLFFTVLLGWWFFRKGPHSRLGKQLILWFQPSSEKGYMSTDAPKDLIGRHGITETPLRPAGRILIDGKPVDAISRGEFYEAGTKIVVVAVSGRRIVVEKEEP
jgi:membrane-bound ClpP family serine protease